MLLLRRKEGQSIIINKNIQQLLNEQKKTNQIFFQMINQGVNHESCNQK